jgi:ribosomal protein S18 acetylase RimI-like enzyme
MIRIRPMELADRPWVNRLLEDAFADATVARKGVLIDASVLPGFVATEGGRPVGFLTYDAAHGECEVVAIISVEEGRGIGRALMDAAHEHAVAAGYRRLWVVTTNDNTRALRFYQLWGMGLCAFYRHGVPPRRAPLEEGQACAPGTGSRRYSAGTRARVRASPGAGVMPSPGE